MSARIPPGSAELWIRFNTPGDAENMYTSIGLDLVGGATINETVVNALNGIVVAALDQSISSAYTIGPCHVIVGQDGGDIRIDSTSAPAAGTGASSAFPPNVALLVRKNTAFGGRRNRGRMYIPGIVEAAAGSDGAIASATLAGYQTAVNDLLVNLIGHAEIEGCLLFHDTAPFAPTTITSLQAQTYLATQRRRLRP